jgi:hypothetical protein
MSTDGSPIQIGSNKQFRWGFHLLIPPGAAMAKIPCKKMGSSSSCPVEGRCVLHPQAARTIWCGGRNSEHDKKAATLLTERFSRPGPA